MSDAVQIESNVSPNVGKINGDSLDMDALRELSNWETEKDLKAKSSVEKKPQAQKKATPVKLEKKEEIEAKDNEGDAKEEGASDDDNGVEGSAEAVEATNEGSGEGAGEASEAESEEDKPSKYLTAKSGEKAYKVPKDALFDVKVDGKTEQLTAQELINKASAGVQYDRELSKLGREKKTFKEEREKFEAEARQVNENAAMLLEISQNGDPEDFIQYYAMLKGEDPDKVLNGLVERVAKYVEQFANMSEREIQLFRENRKYKFQQTLNKRREAQSEAQQKASEEQKQILGELEREGLTKDDFLAAAEELKQKISDGEIDGNLDAFDVVDYAVRRRIESKVEEGIKAVNKGLLSDKPFVTRVLKAVAATENQTGERMTPKEIQALVAAASEVERKSISESLSRKVERHEKSGKTNSQSASSRKQESTGPLTLGEHWARFGDDD